jgi:predicted CoA-substrate-specific enzyme activase
MSNGLVTAGIDIGSTTSKAALWIDEKLGPYVIGPSTTNPRGTARECYEKVLEMAGLQATDVSYIFGTGYGRAKVSFADENISEISAHGKGARFLLPPVRTIIDIGGQDTKVISLDANGEMIDFVTNDKCAAGTGRFLDFIARSVGIDVKDLAGLHASGSYKPVTLSSMCSVFIESEVINLVNDEVPLNSIIQGLHQAVATRVAALVKRIGLVPDVVVTGGVAKNAGLVDELERKLAIKVKTFPADIDPQIMGAVGAAIIAMQRYLKQNNK